MTDKKSDKNGKGRTKSQEVVFALNMLPDDTRNHLVDLVQKIESSTELVRVVTVGNCPACNSNRTNDCETIPHVEDITVGICIDCLKFWCLECGALFKEGQTICDHWKKLP